MQTADLTEEDTEARAGKPGGWHGVGSSQKQSGLAGVWDAVAPALGRLVRAMRLDETTGDDVLQDVYVQALEKCPAGLAPDRIERWLFRVTINRCNLEYRQRSRRNSLYDRLTKRSSGRTSDDVTAEQLQRQEAIQLVRQRLTCLDPQLRTVLVLRYFAQMDSQKIGNLLDLPASTVRGNLRKARLELAQQLQQVGYEHDC